MSLQLVEDDAYRCEGDELADTDVCWLEYCRIASTVGREDILAVVLSELDSPVSPLYDLIDPALQSPHEPGRPKESVTLLANIGNAIMHLVAKAVDDHVNLRMAVEVAR
jgi:hypothetical protein